MNVSEHSRTRAGWAADEKAWSEVEHLTTFSAATLIERLNFPASRAQKYLRRWNEEGRTVCCGTLDDGKTLLYRVAPEPPAALSQGAKPATTSQAIWTAIRHLRRFTSTDILFAIGTIRPDLEAKEVQAYCQFLFKAGFLRVLKKATMRTEAIYAIARDTGPLAPYQKRVRVLIDPNEGCIAWVPEVPA